jgi:uncharacterized protein YcfJ
MTFNVLPTVATVMLLLASAGVGAQQGYGTPPPADVGQPVYAAVISRTPDYRQVKINVPRQQVCRDETVVGALASNPSQKIPVQQTRCEMQYDTHFEQRLVGYTVTYRFGGHVYHTHLVRDPGLQVPVNASGTPAASAGASY